jgi:DNA-binding SARP family transcriptional activator
LARTGAYDDAIQKLQALEAATPYSPEIHLELAQAYQKAGRTEEAAREMKLHDGMKK